MLSEEGRGTSSCPSGPMRDPGPQETQDLLRALGLGSSDLKFSDTWGQRVSETQLQTSKSNSRQFPKLCLRVSRSSRRTTAEESKQGHVGRLSDWRDITCSSLARSFDFDFQASGRFKEEAPPPTPQTRSSWAFGRVQRDAFICGLLTHVHGVGPGLEKRDLQKHL